MRLCRKSVLVSRNGVFHKVRVTLDFVTNEHEIDFLDIEVDIDHIIDSELNSFQLEKIIFTAKQFILREYAKSQVR